MTSRSPGSSAPGKETGRIPAQLFLTLVLALTAFALAACADRIEPPDPAGDKRARVISLVPAATEMLYAIGAGSDVVGVSSFDRFPAEVEKLPRVGALVDPDVERILSLRPTLVVVYGSQEDLVARLERASIGTFEIVHGVDNALADIPRTMRRLGDALGRGATAEAAARRIETELSQMRQRVAGRPRPSTALVFGREPGSLRGIYVSGGVGFLHEVLDAAGGRNVFGDVDRESVQATAEMMLTRRPEVIVELRTIDPPGGSEAARADWSRLASIPAVRSGRIHVLTDPALSIPGPRIVDAVRAVAQAIGN